MVHVVILAGGGGTRLWPLSRTTYPKQFLTLLGQHTLLQHTIGRLGEAVPSQRLWIVTGKEHDFVVRAQLSALPGFDPQTAHVLLEPVGRNTAAAIGLAALHVQRQDPQAVMAVLPADHWITNQSAFLTLLQNGVEWATRGALVTLGIVPDRPETGYGYIQVTGDRLQNPKTTNSASSPTGAHQPTIEAYRVERFVEKPDLPTAQTYVASGTYYWNAGIFIWQAATILQEIATHMPRLYAGLEEIARSPDNGINQKTLTDVYARLESVSIDVGVLEKSAQLVMLPADIGWSDLGEWTAIHRLSPHDVRGNTLSASVRDIDSEESFVYSSGRPIATIGLKKTVVIDTDDALLICSHDRVQDVRTLVHQLQAESADVVHTPRTVHRPWGTYLVLEEGSRFKVKRIVVYPGAALSLQLHHHRSEHWVVVAGVAQVTNGDQEFRLQADQSTYIPQGTRHRLANPGPEPLELIEVQTGSYLGEDDIVRFADLYHRA